MAVLRDDLLDLVGGVGAGDSLGVIEELLVLNLGVLADLDADALSISCTMSLSCSGSMELGSASAIWLKVRNPCSRPLLARRVTDVWLPCWLLFSSFCM